MLFYQKTQNIVENITWSELNHPSLSKRSTVCTRQDLGREHSILLSVTHMLCINQVCDGVSCCVKDGSCSLSSLEWQLMDNFLMWYLTISTNVRRYQTHHRWQFFFQKDSTQVHVCVTQSNWVKMWFSRFPVLPGSAEAQVISGGVVKRLLIVYFIGNISAKQYQNPFTCVKVIASQWWDVFLRRGIVSILHFSLEPIVSYLQSSHNHSTLIFAWPHLCSTFSQHPLFICCHSA